MAPDDAAREDAAIELLMDETLVGIEAAIVIEARKGRAGGREPETSTRSGSGALIPSPPGRGSG